MQYGFPSDNKYPWRPARSYPGPLFTDYRSAGYLNNLLRMKFGTMDDNSYRLYLQHNGIELMNENSAYYQAITNCKDWHIVPTNTTCIYTMDYGVCRQTNPNGIGVKNIGEYRQ